jgi:hypothetical protein
LKLLLEEHPPVKEQKAVFLVDHTVGCGLARPDLTDFPKQRTFLEHAAVCSRLLRNTSNLDDRRKLEDLRKRWKRLALDTWRLEAAEVAEQVKALSDVQTSVLAEIRH